MKHNASHFIHSAVPGSSIQFETTVAPASEKSTPHLYQSVDQICHPFKHTLGNLSIFMPYCILTSFSTVRGEELQF